MTHPRIGFACQYRHPVRDLSISALKLIETPFNPRTTTLRWMDSVAANVAREKLVEVVTHNLAAQLQLLAYVAELPPTLRMLRLSSDLLPFYSHPRCATFIKTRPSCGNSMKVLRRLGLWRVRRTSACRFTPASTACWARTGPRWLKTAWLSSNTTLT